MIETLTIAAILIPCLVIAIVFHEVAHGFAANLLGDPTASERGRLTLNPIAHVDPVGTLLVPGALALAGGPVFGWAKPVPVMKHRLANPRFGMMAVAAAGPLSNFVLAGVGAVLLGATWVTGAQFDLGATGTPLMQSPDGATLYWQTGLYFFILINLFLGLFNLLPIPPFDGSHIVGGLLPRSVQPYWERLQRLSILMILGVVGYTWLFGSGWLVAVLGAPMEWAMGFYLGIADWVSQV
ncbi:MAG: site-2 protease family protein [Pseudomonadota bacterium]